MAPVRAPTIEYLRKLHDFLVPESGAAGGGGWSEARASAAMSGSLGGFEAKSELRKRWFRFDSKLMRRERRIIEDIAEVFYTVTSVNFWFWGWSRVLVQRQREGIEGCLGIRTSFNVCLDVGLCCAYTLFGCRLCFCSQIFLFFILKELDRCFLLFYTTNFTQILFIFIFKSPQTIILIKIKMLQL